MSPPLIYSTVVLRIQYSFMSPANPGFVAPNGVLFFPNVPNLLPLSTFPDLEYQPELFSETLMDAQSVQEITLYPPSSHIPVPSRLPPRVAAPVDDCTSLCIIYSAPTSLPPPTAPPPAATLLPPNWQRIPQKIYDHGRKQLDFVPLECISFEVNGYLGLNMRDALLKRFTGLDGRDDPVLQGATGAISCRLLVCLSS